MSVALPLLVLMPRAVQPGSVECTHCVTLKPSCCTLLLGKQRVWHDWPWCGYGARFVSLGVFCWCCADGFSASSGKLTHLKKAKHCTHFARLIA